MRQGQEGVEGVVLRERGLEIGTLSPFTMCNLSSSLTDMSDGVSDSSEDLKTTAWKGFYVHILGPALSQ